MVKKSKRWKDINPSEDEEQLALIAWAKTIPVLEKYLYHIPNGGSRNLLEAIKLKRMGVKQGISDLHLPYPLNGYHGLWIELKSKKGKPTKAQIEWINEMNSLGFKASFAYGQDEAKKIILEYLYDKK